MLQIEKIAWAQAPGRMACLKRCEDTHVTNGEGRGMWLMRGEGTGRI